MSDDIDIQLEKALMRSADQTIQGNLALWNSLLTMNTIFISVFTITLDNVDNQFLKVGIFLLILLSIISASLIVTSFKISRDSVKKIGYLAMDAMNDRHRNTKEKNVELLLANDDHGNKDWCEKFVIKISAVQGLVILLVVIFLAFFE